MPEFNFNTHNKGRLVATKRFVDVDSTVPTKLLSLPAGTVIKIYPTTPGSAAVYHTNSPEDVTELDETNFDVANSVNADWEIWGAGNVIEKTYQQVNVPLEAIALVVSSGTWIIEVTVDG